MASWTSVRDSSSRSMAVPRDSSPPRRSAPVLATVCRPIAPFAVKAHEPCVNVGANAGIASRQALLRHVGLVGNRLCRQKQSDRGGEPDRLLDRLRRNPGSLNRRHQSVRRVGGKCLARRAADKAAATHSTRTAVGLQPSPKLGRGLEPWAMGVPPAQACEAGLYSGDGCKLGAAGIEPATSCSQSRRATAALRPDITRTMRF